MWKTRLKEYFFCICGAVLVGVGIYFFQLPNHFTIGGVSGLSIILSELLHISSSTIITIANIALLLLGFITVGKQCGLKTILGTAVLSATLMMLDYFLPIAAPLTDQPLMELCFAVLLPAIGSAVLFQYEGSTGGTDIIALILKKYTSLDIGTGLLLADALITCTAFGFGIETALFSLLGLFARSVLIDSVIESINLCKCFTIITAHPQEICDFIHKKLRRGTTVWQAQGGFTGESTHVLLATMRRSQAIRLRKFLRQNYPETFMLLTNSSEVIGKGFRGI